MESGVFGDGPIFLDLAVELFLAFDLTLLAKFLALEAACLALAGACLAAAFALFATALVADDALSAPFAADTIFLAIAALIPALTSLEAPAAATLDTESSLASTSFFAVAAPTPGNAVSFSILEALVCEAILSPVTAMKAFFLEVFL